MPWHSNKSGLHLRLRGGFPHGSKLELFRISLWMQRGKRLCEAKVRRRDWGISDTAVLNSDAVPGEGQERMKIRSGGLRGRGNVSNGVARLSRVNLRCGAHSTGCVGRFAETENMEGNPASFQSAKFQVPVRYTKGDVRQMIRCQSLEHRWGIWHNGRTVEQKAQTPFFEIYLA